MEPSARRNSPQVRCASRASVPHLSVRRQACLPLPPPGRDGLSREGVGGIGTEVRRLVLPLCRMPRGASNRGEPPREQWSWPTGASDRIIELEGFAGMSAWGHRLTALAATMRHVETDVHALTRRVVRRRRAAPAGTATLVVAGIRALAGARRVRRDRVEAFRGSASIGRGSRSSLGSDAMGYAAASGAADRPGRAAHEAPAKVQRRAPRPPHRERWVRRSRSAAVGQDDRLPVGCRRDPHEHWGTGRRCEQRVEQARGQRRCWSGAMQLVFERRSRPVAPDWRSGSGGAARDRLVAPVEDRTRCPRP
jgi:hypothetical protein